MCSLYNKVNNKKFQIKNQYYFVSSSDSLSLEITMTGDIDLEQQAESNCDNSFLKTKLT